MYLNDPFCDICQIFPCSMAHITVCPKIVTYLKHSGVKLNLTCDLDWIYGSVDIQLTNIKIFQVYYEAREELISLKRSQGTTEDDDNSVNNLV